MDIIREGVFGTSFVFDKEMLYFRMERITPNNQDSWKQYKRMSSKLTITSRGIITILIFQAGEEQPSFEEVKDVTGFDLKEYTTFMYTAAKLKGKMERVIENTCTGAIFMDTSYCPSFKKYIAYITTNPNFDIIKTPLFPLEDMTLKEYITFYKDILITVGCDFTEDISYHNRGIFRNPYWVFEGKYNGLSILLHGFTGIVTNTYYSDKTHMEVTPVGSMQCLLQQYLLRDEGYTTKEDKNIDIKDIKVTPTSPQQYTFLIKVKALIRIIDDTLAK